MTAQHPYPWHLRLSWLLVLLCGLLAYIATFVIMVLTGNRSCCPQCCWWARRRSR